MKKRNYIVVFAIFKGCLLLAVNYYTIKILSATRAYINGESEYSKGQKDALLYLSTLIQTGDSVYWSSFHEAIQVPLGDNLARHSILNHENENVTLKYFLMGKNDPRDIPDMIWLFNAFRTSFMQKPIQIWSDAEPLINELNDIGNAVYVKTGGKTLSENEKTIALKRISFLSSELYKKESEFSKVLSETARNITFYLFMANIILTCLILGSFFSYVIIAYRRLSDSKELIEITNKDLVKANMDLSKSNEELLKTNKELDTLIYSLSHDLKSPLISIRYLIGMLMDEDDLPTIREYFNSITGVINKLESFIVEIIDYFKIKKLSLSYKEFSLKSMIEDILDNNKFSSLLQGITINREIELDEMYSDELMVNIILSNLISNAIKYSDGRKPVRTIGIKSCKKLNSYIIEIADNGIGIDNMFLGKIYDMFYVATNNKNKGSGLGLYILKQNIEKLNGKIEVQSELNIGTKFTVTLPEPRQN